MKPPKSVRKAVRSFLGGKKKQINIDDSQRVIEDNTSSASTVSQVTPKKINHNERTTSLPPATKQRSEEWNRHAVSKFDSEFEKGMKRTVSASSKRSQEIQSLKFPPRNVSAQSVTSYNSQNSFGRSQVFHDVNPWDSVSRTSSYADPFTQRDSGAFDMYMNEDVLSDKQPSEQNFEHHSQMQQYPSRNLKRYCSDTNLFHNDFTKPREYPRRRTASFSGNSQPFRTTSYTSNASDKLLSCMDTLNNLTKKLESLNQVSNEVEKFQQVSRKISSMSTRGNAKQQSYTPNTSNMPPRSLDWSIGEHPIRHSSSNHSQNERNGRRFSETSSTDSGINSCWELSNTANEMISASRPRSSRFNPFENDLGDNQKILQNTVKNVHLKSDSLSSGYSSGSGGMQSQMTPLNYYPQIHPSNNHFPMTYPYEAKHYPVYGYNQEYNDEDVYSYGSFSYASSSLYDEDLNQHNGWFYLPSSLSETHSSYHQQMPQYCHSLDYSQFQYPRYDPTFSLQNSYYPGNHAVPQPEQPELQKINRDFSQNQSDAPVQISRLSCASSTVRSGDGASSVTSEMSDWKKFGSFRYRNGERTAVVPATNDTKRRKMVRFSQTVKQRVETDSSEMEDSTSLIKGEAPDQEEVYDTPKSMKPVLSNISDAECHVNNTLSNQPIYEFPSGHIESSCMCSDCILARSSSQVKPAANFVYY